MKDLIKSVLMHGNFGGMQSQVLLLFSILMAFVTAWVLMPGSKEYYERVSKLNDEGEEP